MVYDITNADTFARAKTWVRELQRQVSIILPFILLSKTNSYILPHIYMVNVHYIYFQARPDIVIALAGNKSDLGTRRTVEYEEANGYAEENGLLFMETSAKVSLVCHSYHQMTLNIHENCIRKFSLTIQMHIFRMPIT